MGKAQAHNFLFACIMSIFTNSESLLPMPRDRTKLQPPLDTSKTFSRLESPPCKQRTRPLVPGTWCCRGNGTRPTGRRSTSARCTCSAVPWVCQLFSGYVSCALGMSAVPWVCQLFSGYVSCTLSMSAVPWVCQLFFEYVSCSSGMSSVPWVFQLFSGYVSCCLGMSAVSWICQLFPEYVSCSLGMSAVLWVCQLFPG